MWTCPDCNHEFYNNNQSHSGGHYTVGDFSRGKSEKMIGLFHYFLSEYRKIGVFDIHPAKNRGALLTKMRFCSINKIGADYINIHLVLTQPYSGATCFIKLIIWITGFLYVTLKYIRNQTSIQNYENIWSVLTKPETGIMLKTRRQKWISEQL